MSQQDQKKELGTLFMKVLHDGNWTGFEQEITRLKNETQCPFGVLNDQIEFEDGFCTTVLIELSIIGNENMVRKMIESGVNVNQSNQYDETALMLAVWHDQENIVDLLCQAGADLTLKNLFDENVLMYAAQKRNIKMIQKLMEYGVSLSLSDEEIGVLEESVNRGGDPDAVHIIQSLNEEMQLKNSVIKRGGLEKNKRRL